MSLIVLVVSVASSVIAYEFTRLTGFGTFLFKRPKWAWISGQDSRTPQVKVQPAE